MSAPNSEAAGAARTIASKITGPALGRAAGHAAAAILLAAAGIHAYWALGGDWAAATAYGSTDLPPRPAVAVVTVLIGAGAALLLARVGTLRVTLPAPVLRWGPWAMAAVLALTAVNNVLAPSDSYAREWHVWFFGPLLLVVALLCTVVARSRNESQAIRHGADAASA